MKLISLTGGLISGLSDETKKTQFHTAHAHKKESTAAVHHPGLFVLKPPTNVRD